MSKSTRSEDPTSLHDERLNAVIAQLMDSGSRRILDLGCGEGALLARLVQHQEFEKITGVDISTQALAKARNLLTDLNLLERVELMHASFDEADERLCGYDAAVLLETIEHIDPKKLSSLETAVFKSYQPQTVIITTPNADYNIVHGLKPGTFRHKDHCFEWGRAKFRTWATGVAGRNGCTLAFSDIGEFHPTYGSSTQMAVFWRLA